MNPLGYLRSSSAGLRCSVAQRWVASPVATAPAVLAAHVQECLICQAESARERALRRALASLGDEIDNAPPRLVSSVVDAINRPALRPAPVSAGTSAVASSARSERTTLARAPRRVAAASASAVALGVAVVVSRRHRAIPV